MHKAIPWAVAAVLGLSSIAIFVTSRQALAEKEAALRTTEERFLALKAEMEAKVKEAELRAQAANERASAADAKSTQVINEASSKIQQLASEATAKLQAANLPEATLAVTFRKAVLFSGSVATLKNTSTQSSTFSVVAERQSANQQRRFELVIDGGAMKEIGEKEGWAFVSGDLLQVSQPGHKQLSFTAR